MLKDITIGQYYPANSKIHRLDPRTKLIATIVFMIALFVVNQFWPYVIILGIVAGIMYGAVLLLEKFILHSKKFK